MAPTLKVVPATTFLVSNHRITIPEIPALGAQVVGPLIHAARDAGLEVIGDLHFFYRALSGDPMTEPFDFAIGVPIASAGPIAGPYEVREAPDYHCLATEYVGSMQGISAAWGQLYEALQSGDYAHGGESREVYRQWVDFDSPENITELQAGIAPVGTTKSEVANNGD